MSNVTDLDPIAAEPGVSVRLASWPQDLIDADLVIVPGTRATVHDLAWLRERGFDEALRRRAAAGRPVLGICGGLQALGGRIYDGVESDIATTEGLGLLPVRTEFADDKVLDLPSSFWRGEPVSGYRIHHGRPCVEGGEPFLDGCQVGSVWGMTWHGAFESDGFRRVFLGEVAALAGRDWKPGERSFADVREERLDALGDLVEEHLDTRALWQLLESGVPGDLPHLALVRPDPEGFSA
jgi:adenosylcobyric acid synthase